MPICYRGLKNTFLGFKPQTHTAILDPKYRSTAFSTSKLSLIGFSVAQSLAPSIAPKTANRVLYVNSFTLSQDQVLAAFEKLSGKQWKVESTDLKANVKDTYARLAKGDFSTAAVLLQDAIFDSTAGTNWDARGISSNALLELPKEDLEATLQKVLQ